MTRPGFKTWKTMTGQAALLDSGGRECTDLCVPQGHPHHDVCKSWLDTVITGDMRFGVSPLVLSLIIRFTTNPRIFTNPSSLEESIAFCDDLIGQPHCEILQPSERHWEIFTRLCIDTETRGPRVTDAWLAALAIEHGCSWITYDRDYARFPGLNWRLPTL